MIDKKTSVVVGPHRSFLSGNQRVIGSHANWASVIGHCRLRRPTRTNDNQCFFSIISANEERKEGREEWELPNWIFIVSHSRKSPKVNARVEVYGAQGACERSGYCALMRVRPLNLGLSFFTSKVASSWPSVDRFG